MKRFFCSCAIKPLQFATLNIVDQASIYDHLKTTAQEAGNTQLASDFYFWQQFYLGQAGKWLSWNHAYLILSAYGLSAALPLFWFVLLFFGFAALYHQCFTSNDWATSWNLSVLCSLPAFGLSKLLDILSTQREELTREWYFWLAYGITLLSQVLLQGFLLFQIGAAIRNKVKR